MCRAKARTATLMPTLLDADMGSGCPVCCARPGAPSFREEVILLAFPLASRPSADDISIQDVLCGLQR